MRTLHPNSIGRRFVRRPGQVFGLPEEAAESIA
jgi:hypothetical protein